MSDPSLNNETLKSRFETPRMTLAKDAWKWGAGTFFADKIPFSIRSGPLFAKRLVLLYQQSVNSSPKQETYTVVEWGAGMGMLAKHFLDQLKESDPDLYKKTQLYITEYSKKMLKTIKQSGILNGHQKQATLKNIDATTKKPDIPNANFAWSTYLIDSLDACHFEWKNGELFELCIETTLKDDWLIDSTTVPPKLVDKVTCQRILNTDDDRRLNLAPKLLKQLDESIHATPIEDRNLAPDLSQFLIETVSNLSPDADCRFNFHESILAHLDMTWQNLADDGVYVISDFGFADTLPNTVPELLLANYRVSAFYAVAFPIIQTYLKQLGASTTITTHESDQTQECLMVKGPISDETEAVFKSNFAQSVGFERIIEAMDAISMLQNKETYHKDIDQHLSQLTPDEKNDYTLLTTLGTQLLDDGELAAAKTVAQTLLDHYKNMAVDGHRLMACIYQNEGDFKAAKTHVDQVLAIYENDPLTYGILGMGHMIEHRFKEAIDALAHAMRYQENADQLWQIFLAYVICLRHEGADETLRSILNWIEQTALLHPNLITQDIKHRFLKQLPTPQ